MPRHVYTFEDPDRFVAGAIGEPGSRSFYLQAREGTRVVSVLLEKVQVAALAERLSELLEQLRRQGAEIPEGPNEADKDSAPLDQPITEAFRVGAMAIVWDGEEGSVLVEARAMTDDEGEAVVDFDDDEEGPDLVRVKLDPAEALAFAARATEVVEAGRPPCPFCGQPLNPEGHICARRNGYMH